MPIDVTAENLPPYSPATTTIDGVTLEIRLVLLKEVGMRRFTAWPQCWDSYYSTADSLSAHDSVRGGWILFPLEEAMWNLKQRTPHMNKVDSTLLCEQFNARCRILN